MCLRNKLDAPLIYFACKCKEQDSFDFIISFIDVPAAFYCRFLWLEFLTKEGAQLSGDRIYRDAPLIAAVISKPLKGMEVFRAAAILWL